VGVVGEPGLFQLVFVAAEQGPVAEPLEQELGSLAWGVWLVVCGMWYDNRNLQMQHPKRQG
jgi:hypothetical protein